MPTIPTDDPAASRAAAPSVETPSAVAAPGVAAAPGVEAPRATAAPGVEAPRATAAPGVEAPRATAAPGVEAPRGTAAPGVEAPRGTAAPGVEAPREKTFLLAAPEQRLLEAIARRLPRFVRPDHLTVLALGAAVAFAVAAASGAFFVAAALLVVHWFGDSLDGTLARVRRAERPRYGYYLDHLADAFATALIGARPRPLLVDAPGGGARAGRRLPGAVDQLVPGDAGARALLARLRAARADRGADRPDGAPGRRGVRGRGLGARADAARRGRPGRRGGRWCSRLAARAVGNLRVLAAREPYAAK